VPARKTDGEFPPYEARLADAAARGETLQVLELGMRFCETFMDAFMAQNHLQEFVLRSMEDLVLWLRRIAMCDFKAPGFRGINRAASAQIASALRTVRARLSIVLTTEASVTMCWAKNLEALQMLQERWQIMIPTFPAELPRTLRNTQALAANVNRLSENVKSFLGTAQRCTQLATELTGEADALAEWLAPAADHGIVAMDRMQSKHRPLEGASPSIRRKPKMIPGSPVINMRRLAGSVRYLND